jgi:hypothetical protein
MELARITAWLLSRTNEERRPPSMGFVNLVGDGCLRECVKRRRASPAPGTGSR